jgi:hypothetical protein
MQSLTGPSIMHSRYSRVLTTRSDRPSFTAIQNTGKIMLLYTADYCYIMGWIVCCKASAHTSISCLTNLHTIFGTLSDTFQYPSLYGEGSMEISQYSGSSSLGILLSKQQNLTTIPDISKNSYVAVVECKYSRCVSLTVKCASNLMYGISFTYKKTV